MAASSSPLAQFLAPVIAQQEAAAPNAQYEAFKLKYWNDPVGFARDCIDWGTGDGLASYQNEILSDLVEHSRECARGPRGLGKTTTSVVAILWFSLTRDGKDWKIPTTAGSWNQLTRYLWPEVHKWAGKLKWGVIGRKPFNLRTELMTLSLRLDTGEAFAITSDIPELMEGAHADHLLFIYDESKSIPAKTFDACEGTFANAGIEGREAFVMAVSTPGEPDGRFYAIQQQAKGFEDWNVKRVTLEDTIRENRISADYAKQRLLQWGIDSQMYQNHILGNFAAASEQGFIPLSWVEDAMERWEQWKAAGEPGTHCAAGVDVGDGGDKSAYAKRLKIYGAVRYLDTEGVERYFVSDGGVYSLTYDNERGIMPVAGKTKGILDNHGGCVVIDKNGVGAGAVGRLREMGYARVVIAFNGGEKPPAKARDRTGEVRFRDKRTWAFAVLRDLLNPIYGHNFILPPDDLLKGDLTMPKALPLDSENRLKIESKTEIKKRTKGRSTDGGDAVMMSIVDEVLGSVQREKSNKKTHSHATYS